MAIDFAALFDPPPRKRQAPAAGAFSTDVQAPVVPGNAPPSARLEQGQEAQAGCSQPLETPAQASARPGPTAEQVVQESPSAPSPRGDFHSVWLSIPITSRIYAFDRRDRLCYGPDCYLWTFERSPIWYYQSETPLPPLRRQGEDYYVDTQAVLELAKTPPEGGFQEQNRPKTFACR
jgi:hypothetical protein